MSHFFDFNIFLEFRNDFLGESFCFVIHSFRFVKFVLKLGVFMRYFDYSFFWSSRVGFAVDFIEFVDLFFYSVKLWNALSCVEPQSVHSSTAFTNCNSSKIINYLSSIFAPAPAFCFSEPELVLAIIRF